MGQFEFIGHCLDLILSCTDQELKNLGFLEYVQSLRETISHPQWARLELYFQIIATAIENKKGITTSEVKNESNPYTQETPASSEK